MTTSHDSPHNSFCQPAASPPGTSLPAASLLKILIRCGVLIALIGWSSGCTTLNRSGNSAGSSPSVTATTGDLANSQAELLVKSGETAERQGNTDEAIRCYEQAQSLGLLSLGPQDNSLSRRLAVLYDQRGDDDRARAAYEQALGVPPSDPELLNDFGVFYLNREQWAAAETWLRRALAARPGHERATVNLAMSLAMQGRLNESYEEFSRVVGPAAAYSNIGVLLTRQGRVDEARDHFRRALAIDQTVYPAGEFLSRLEHTSRPTSASTRPDQRIAGDRAFIQTAVPIR